MKTEKIIAIGDSFFYLNDHLEETGFRCSKGILSRVLERLAFQAEIVNLGQNGWKTSDWAMHVDDILIGDIYIIMLGTNDWWCKIPLGIRNDYLSRTKGTILGNLGFIVGHIKGIAPQAKIFLCNPTERTDFVYVNDMMNFAMGSYKPHNGVTIQEVANAICSLAKEEGVINVNTHDESGINCYNAVKFKRCVIGEETVNLPYPDYIFVPFDPMKGAYPYPLEAIGTTYDGLHPSDEGAASIAKVIADAINKANQD